MQCMKKWEYKRTDRVCCWTGSSLLIGFRLVNPPNLSGAPRRTWENTHVTLTSLETCGWVVAAALSHYPVCIRLHICSCMAVWQALNHPDNSHKARLRPMGTVWPRLRVSIRGLRGPQTGACGWWRAMAGPPGPSRSTCVSSHAAHWLISCHPRPSSLW